MRLTHIETRNLVALSWLLLITVLIVLAIRDPLRDDLLDLFIILALASTAPVTTALAARGNPNPAIMLAATVVITAASQYSDHRLGFMLFAIISMTIPATVYLGRQLRPSAPATAKSPSAGR